MATSLATILAPVTSGNPNVPPFMGGQNVFNMSINKAENGLVANINGKQYAFEGSASDAATLLTAIKAVINTELTT